jgi:phage tail-like protein
VDPNGTRFQMLLGQADWGSCRIEGQPVTLGETWASLATGELLSRHGWDASHSELTLPTQIFRFPTIHKTAELTGDMRRGADVDIYGSRYWIDDMQSSILVRSVGSGTVSTFWTVGGQTPAAPSSTTGEFADCAPQIPAPSTIRGLAVTEDDYLVVGVVDPPGCLVFDLHAGGPPRQVLWPTGFNPFDIATGACGAWILDRDITASAPRLWLLDRHLNVVGLSSVTSPQPQTPVFSAVDGTPPLANMVCEPAPVVTLGVALPLTRIVDPVAVETLPDGSALILDNAGDGGTPAFSQLWRFSLNSGLTGPFSLRDLTSLAADPELSLLGHDFVLVQAAATDTSSTLGTLLIVAPNGEQAYAFAVVPGTDNQTLAFDALPEYWPMRLYGGRGLLIDRGRPFYNSRTDWVPLVQQRNERYETELTLISPVEPDPTNRSERHALDGREPDCVWHRLLFDGCLPHDTEIHVWSRAANLESDLVNAEWQAEPDPYKRGTGSELPFVSTNTSADRGTWELLFQRARGRFLQLRIRLVGNTRSSPRLRALRAYFPRFSYLEHYLPAAYRDDAVSASFLDRFLANLEGIYTTLEDRLENVQALFDARTAPAEDLVWLATWLGLVLDGNWDEARQRLLISSAPELFRLRGTRLGIIRAIRLATDACPTPALFDEMLDDEAAPQPGRLPAAIRVIEQFRTRQAPGVVFGDPSEVVGPGFTTGISSWTPTQGPEPLNKLFRAYLTRQYGSLEAARVAWAIPASDTTPIVLPPTRPTNDAAAADWTRFLQTSIGFTYTPVDINDTRAYQDFLARRYATADALTKAYGISGTGVYNQFSDVALPTAMPVQVRQLSDWIQFVSIVAPTARRAHRFTVLVPTALTPADDDRGALIDRVQRIVNLEKPAHTMFDVKEYWALFRVGEARLGFDSLLDRGSRLLPVVLDSSYLAEGYLPSPHPFNLADRMVVGRDHVGDGRPL